MHLPLTWFALFAIVALFVNFGWTLLLWTFLLGGTFVFGMAVGKTMSDDKPQQARPRAQTSGATPPPRPRPRPPAAHWLVLGLKPTATLQDINSRYHELAKRWHPDRPGGSLRAMKNINLARDLARQEVGTRRTQ